MIHFACKHCGKAVHVPEAHAGGRGRCPTCAAIVRIPGEPMSEGDCGAAALAAALNGQNDPSDHDAVPPPPATREPEDDEFQLLDGMISSADTDTYPAIREGQPPKGRAEPAHATIGARGVARSSAAHAAPRGAWPKNLIITLVLAAVVLGVVVTAVVWLRR